MSPLPHPVEAFDPPVRLRLRGPDRVTQLLVFTVGVCFGFIAGTGYVLTILGSHL